MTIFIQYGFCREAMRLMSPICLSFFFLPQWQWWILGFLSIFLFACAEKQSEVAWICPQAPDDQKGSFFKEKRDYPLTLSLDSEFSAAEMMYLITAMKSWNNEGRRRWGKDFFSLSRTNIPLSVKRTDFHELCSESSQKKHQEVYVLKEPSSVRWEALQIPSNANGVTFSCQVNGKIADQNIIIHLPGPQEVQLRSVALHEYGHALGLDHSCNSKGDTDYYRSCDAFTKDHPYRLAVLFPFLYRFELPRSREFSGPRYEYERKERLFENDRDRASCLMGAQ